MAVPSEQSITDPLLRPDNGPRDARGAPVRAPLGNSVWTLVLFVLLVGVGIGVWSLTRPDDLTGALGGREWVVVDVDGKPAVNTNGTLSTFVLDGGGEVRGPVGCNVATGVWEYQQDAKRLSIDWTTQTDLVCPPDWPATYLPDGGDVELAGGVLFLRSRDEEMRAITLADHDAQPGEIAAGDWTTGGDDGDSVEIGRRGLFRIETCEGSWASGADDLGMTVRFDEVQIQREGCDLDRLWLERDPFRVVEFEGSIYLHRERAIFPLDREVVRLDPNEDNGVTPVASP
ncbi:MAG: META domain-containing protein [Ilumatobacteraceae bacterium]